MEPPYRSKYHQYNGWLDVDIFQYLTEHFPDSRRHRLSDTVLNVVFAQCDLKCERMCSLYSAGGDVAGPLVQQQPAEPHHARRAPASMSYHLILSVEYCISHAAKNIGAFRHANLK